MANRVVRVLFEGVDHLTGMYQKIGVASQASADQQKLAADKTALAMDKVSHAADRAKSRLSGLGGAIGLVGLGFGLKDVVQQGLAKKRANCLNWPGRPLERCAVVVSIFSSTRRALAWWDGGQWGIWLVDWIASGHERELRGFGCYECLQRHLQLARHNEQHLIAEGSGA